MKAESQMAPFWWNTARPLSGARRRKRTFVQPHFGSTRTSLVYRVLYAIEADSGDSGAWLQLGALNSGGFDPLAVDRLVALVSAALAWLGRLVAAGADRHFGALS